MYGFTYGAKAPPRVVVVRGGNANVAEAQAEAAEAQALAAQALAGRFRLGMPAMLLLGGLAIMLMGKK